MLLPAGCIEIHGLYQFAIDVYLLLVECDSEPDGHGLRITTPSMLPRNIHLYGYVSSSPHADLGEVKKFQIYPKFSHPEVGSLQGPGSGCDS